jgi:hypothetical protein
MQAVPPADGAVVRDDGDSGDAILGDGIALAAGAAAAAVGADTGDLDADDRRLSELGRRTIEMFAVAHIFAVKLQKAYQEEQSLLKARELIEQEDAAHAAEAQRQLRKAEADKERRAKKKVRARPPCCTLGLWTALARERRAREPVDGTAVSGAAGVSCDVGVGVRLSARCMGEELMAAVCACSRRRSRRGRQRRRSVLRKHAQPLLCATL